MRVRLRKPAPTGLMQSTTCRLARTRSMKSVQQSSAIATCADGMPSFLATARMASMIELRSSLEKRFGTSPELSTLLTSSRKASSLICVSEKRNMVGLPSTPVRL